MYKNGLATISFAATLLLILGAGCSAYPVIEHTPNTVVTSTDTVVNKVIPDTTKPKPTVSKNAAIAIANYTFQIPLAKVKVGTTVTWTNYDTANHSVVSDDNSFMSGIIGYGKSYSHTFTKAGTYKYHCSIHASMVGTIFVE